MRFHVAGDKRGIMRESKSQVVLVLFKVDRAFLCLLKHERNVEKMSWM